MTAARQRTTVVGIFEDRERANEAVSELMKSGFRQDQIGVAMRDAERRGDTTTTTTGAADESHSGSGAMAGALTGLGLGTLAGLGVLAGVIPVVGPAIAGGTLGIILSNAAAGAGIAGLAGALIGAGVPEHEARYYDEEFQAGGTIVTVTADGMADEAMAILRKYGAYDVTNRNELADRTSHAETRTAGAAAATAQPAAHRQTGTEGDSFQVKEERLHAQKHPVETGSVNVRKEVHTETRTMEVPVQREEVIVERNPVHGRAATEGVAGDIREGEEIRVPVREEHVTVTKEPVVTEEVRVGKRTVQDSERVRPGAQGGGQGREDRQRRCQESRRRHQGPRHHVSSAMALARSIAGRPPLHYASRLQARDGLRNGRTGSDRAPVLDSHSVSSVEGCDVPADHAQEAAHFLGIEIRVVTDGELALAVPVALPGAADGVNDDALERGSPQELVDQVLRGEEFDFTRVHRLSLLNPGTGYVPMPSPPPCCLSSGSRSYHGGRTAVQAGLAP